MNLIYHISIMPIDTLVLPNMFGICLKMLNHGSPQIPRGPFFFRSLQPRGRRCHTGASVSGCVARGRGGCEACHVGFTRAAINNYHDWAWFFSTSQHEMLMTFLCLKLGLATLLESIVGASWGLIKSTATHQKHAVSYRQSRHRRSCPLRQREGTSTSTLNFKIR